mgnify:CR=1 FL=1
MPSGLPGHAALEERMAPAHHHHRLIAAAVFVFSQRQLGAASTYSGNTRKNVLAALVMASAIGFYDGFIGPGDGDFPHRWLCGLGFDFVTAAGNA